MAAANYTRLYGGFTRSKMGKALASHIFGSAYILGA